MIAMTVSKIDLCSVADEKGSSIASCIAKADDDNLQSLEILGP